MMAETDAPDAVAADTEAVLWFLADDPRLSATAAERLEALERTRRPIWVCAYSLVEVRYLVEKGKVDHDQERRLFEAVADSDTAIELVPVTVDVVRHLPRVPRRRIKDPGDRLVVATAIELAVALVTSDGPITDLRVVECIW